MRRPPDFVEHETVGDDAPRVLDENLQEVEFLAGEAQHLAAEANLAAQVSQVEVYGWNPEQKKAIVGKAVAGEESGHDPRRRSGGERLGAAIGRKPVLEVRQPVFTEAEAKRRAQAILNDHAKKFLTGDAESIGLPALLPDRNITLGNLGEPFSKTYYIQQTTHKIDSSGYRTRVKVKETSL